MNATHSQLEESASRFGYAPSGECNTRKVLPPLEYTSNNASWPLGTFQGLLHIARRLHLMTVHFEDDVALLQCRRCPAALPGFTSSITAPWMPLGA